LLAGGAVSPQESSDSKNIPGKPICFETLAWLEPGIGIFGFRLVSFYVARPRG
jgi:hypothetical protein